MAVIKSLEKIYLFKNVGIPEYYLGGNVEILGESWKNQGLELALSAKTYIQNVIISKFENLFGNQFKSINTPMSEDYHPEIDDSPLCNDGDSARYRIQYIFKIHQCILLLHGLNSIKHGDNVPISVFNQHIVTLVSDFGPFNCKRCIMPHHMNSKPGLLHKILFIPP